MSLKPPHAPQKKGSGKGSAPLSSTVSVFDLMEPACPNAAAESPGGLPHYSFGLVWDDAPREKKPVKEEARHVSFQATLLSSIPKSLIPDTGFAPAGSRYRVCLVPQSLFLKQMPHLDWMAFRSQRDQTVSTGFVGICLLPIVAQKTTFVGTCPLSRTIDFKNPSRGPGWGQAGSEGGHHEQGGSHRGGGGSHQGQVEAPGPRGRQGGCGGSGDSFGSNRAQEPSQQPLPRPLRGEL